MKKHAFLILAHKSPSLIRRIMKVLESDNHYFFLHVDKKTPNIEDFKKAVSDIRNTTVLEKRISVFHAGISTTEAELALFEAVRKSRIDFDYLHLISGQDYPLRSNEQFDEFFEHNTTSYVYIDDKTLRNSMAKNYDRSANEYHFNHTNKKYVQIYEKLHLGRLLRLFYRRKTIDGYVGGWQWFSWNKKVFNFIMDYLQSHPDYLQRFDHTASPDEHIFVTLINNHLDELDVAPEDPLRYISWHPHRPINDSYRPFILEEVDYPFIIDSRAFFCRKIDERLSASLLDKIDAQRGEPYDINNHTKFV